MTKEVKVFDKLLDKKEARKSSQQKPFTLRF